MSIDPNNPHFDRHAIVITIDPDLAQEIGRLHNVDDTAAVVEILLRDYVERKARQNGLSTSVVTLVEARPLSHHLHS